MAKPFSALPGFATQLALQIEVGSTKALRQAAAAVLSNVVQNSPVDTGRLRGNWQVGINSPPNGSGGGTVPVIPPGTTTVYVSNNVRYINYVNGGVRGNEANAGFIQAAVMTAVSQIRGFSIFGPS